MHLTSLRNRYGIDGEAYRVLFETWMLSETGCYRRRDAETGCYPVSTDTELDNIKEAHHNGKV